MTHPSIEAIERRLGAATPGPWTYEEDEEGDSMGWVVHGEFASPLFKVCGDSAQQAINAEFSAAAPTDIATLLSLVRSLEKERDEARNKALTIVFSGDYALLGGIQISINDDNGGYRISGPKYSGASTNIKRHILTPRDAGEIESYLSQLKRPTSEDKTS